jgi:hypothetical protein
MKKKKKKKKERAAGGSYRSSFLSPRYITKVCHCLRASELLNFGRIESITGVLIFSWKASSNFYDIQKPVLQ